MSIYGIYTFYVCNNVSSNLNVETVAEERRPVLWARNVDDSIYIHPNPIGSEVKDDCNFINTADPSEHIDINQIGYKVSKNGLFSDTVDLTVYILKLNTIGPLTGSKKDVLCKDGNNFSSI